MSFNRTSVVLSLLATVCVGVGVLGCGNMPEIPQETLPSRGDSAVSWEQAQTVLETEVAKEFILPDVLAISYLDMSPPPADPGQVGLVFNEINTVMGGSPLVYDDGYSWLRWYPRLGSFKQPLQASFAQEPVSWFDYSWDYCNEGISPPLPHPDVLTPSAQKICGFMWGARAHSSSLGWPQRIVLDGSGYIRPIPAAAVAGTSFRLGMLDSLSGSFLHPLVTHCDIAHLEGRTITFTVVYNSPAFINVCQLTYQDQGDNHCVVDVRSRVRFHEQAKSYSTWRIGIGPALSSMYWRGPAEIIAEGGDPQLATTHAHDADTVVLIDEVGGRWHRPIINPGSIVKVQRYTVRDTLHGFGFIQADRTESHYTEYPAGYALRPSYMIENFKAVSAGVPVPMELQIDMWWAENEYYDNTVLALILGDNDYLSSQEPIDITYRLVGTLDPVDQGTRLP